MLVIVLPVELLLVVGAAAIGVPHKYMLVLWIAIAIAVPVSAVNSVFNAALYRYAVSGSAIWPFAESDLENAYAYKQNRVRRLFHRQR